MSEEDKSRITIEWPKRMDLYSCRSSNEPFHALNKVVAEQLGIPEGEMRVEAFNVHGTAKPSEPPRE